MIFRQLFDATSSTYTYLLACEETREAVLIDPVFEQHTRDLALVRELALTLRFTLDTHVHADHVTGAWLMKVHAHAQIALAASAHADGTDVPLTDGDVVRFGAHTLVARATPGHTNSCLTYVLDDGKMAFTGDALLIRGAGRTDFQQGDARALFHSITRVIFALDDDCLLYPAHDYQGRTVTTVREEKAFNPRCGGEANEDDFIGYMKNLGLPHPRQIDVAVPANMKCGEPPSTVSTTPSRLPVTRSYAGVPELSLEWLREHRDEVTLVDVREPHELTGELGAVDGIVHMPLGALAARVSELSSATPVVLICRSGRRSAQACAILERAGLHDVANATGGMLQWRARGF